MKTRFPSCTSVVIAACSLTLSLASSASEGGDRSVHEKINDLIKKYDRPASEMSNSDVADLFKEDDFHRYLQSYPVSSLAGDYDWEIGDGTTFKGPVSDLTVKAPFTGYLPLAEGPVLDSNETYKIGFAYHGANHPWLVSLADTAVWEANRHPNVEIDVRDAQFDDRKMGQAIQTWITQDYDAIVIWPLRKAPMGPPVDRAERAEIPVITLDRRAGSDRVSSEVMGNFYANGLQQGLYLNHALEGSGNLILNRKPQGSTADAIRTGAFLQVIGDESYTILNSYHTDSKRDVAYNTMENALQRYSDVNAVFNTGGEEALGALSATLQAGRLQGDGESEKTVFLANDDSKEVLQEVRKGNIDMVSPYTPLIGDIGVRAAIRHIGARNGMVKEPPKQIITPNLPMISRSGDTINGIDTLTPDEWPYAYGPDPSK